MTDHLSKEKRSWNMGRIRSIHTKPEIIVRSLLHRIGYRFKINDKQLPGRPDIVLPKYKTVIFVNGCFWHQHNKCSKATIPSSNREYWLKKFEKNVLRDRKVRKELRKLKWKVIIIWECEIIKNPEKVINNITLKLEGNSSKYICLNLKRSKILKLAEKRSDYLIYQKNKVK